MSLNDKYEQQSEAHADEDLPDLCRLQITGHLKFVLPCNTKCKKQKNAL